MKNTNLAIQLVFLFVTYLVTKCESRVYDSNYKYLLRRFGDHDDNYRRFSVKPKRFGDKRVGGYEPIDTDSQQVQEIAEDGLEYFRLHSDVRNPPNLIVKVIDAMRQIVNGQNFKVTFKAATVVGGDVLDDWVCHTNAYKPVYEDRATVSSTDCYKIPALP